MSKLLRADSINTSAPQAFQGAAGILKRAFPWVTWTLFTPTYLWMCVGVFLFFSGYHCLSPVLPVYIQKQAPELSVGMFMAIFMLASVIARPWAGRLADSIRKRHLMVASALVFACCGGLYPLLGHEAVLLLGLRIIHGISFAIFVTAANSALIQYLPPAHKAEGIGYFSNAIKLAMAFSPALGVALVTSGQGIYAFWLSLLLGLVAWGSAWLAKPVQKPMSPELSSLQERFVGSSFTQKTPLIHPKALFPGAIMLTNSMAFGALIPYMSFLTAERHLEVGGYFYPIYAVTLMSSRSVTGQWSDRLGRYAVLIPAMTGVVISLLLLSWANHPWLFLTSAALYGFSAGSVQPGLMAIAADQATTNPVTGKSDHGALMGTFTALTDLGIALGMYMMGNLGSQWGYGWMVSAVAVCISVALIPLWWVSSPLAQQVQKMFFFKGNKVPSGGTLS